MGARWNEPRDHVEQAGGQTQASAAAEVGRTLAAVAQARGVPPLPMGPTLAAASGGIDREEIGWRVGVGGPITPCNSPLTGPLWRGPMALGAGTVAPRGPHPRRRRQEVRGAGAGSTPVVTIRF